MKIVVRFIRTGIYLGIVIAILGILNYHLISWAAASKNSYLLEDVPKKDVALVLGTAQFLKNGRTNLYFKFRVDAVADLWEAGKIKYVLISGDNGRKEYDEPTAMKKALIKKGLPAEVIYLDYAGFRTLDSMVREKKVFGQSDLIIVSQQFHVERALLLAKFNDMQAFGYNAVDVDVYNGFGTKFREYLARIKFWIDYLFGVDPKFLGESIAIP